LERKKKINSKPKKTVTLDAIEYRLEKPV